ncbi:MAG: esterase-like activity of phytase family protein [Acidimicrobiia bacterium]|nr:esterase-like activity of phytase family protein [Acidimicrobiia bacterium]
MIRRVRGNGRRLAAVLALMLATTLVAPAAAMSQSPSGANDGTMTVADVAFAGQVIVPTGTSFEGTEIGGLSSITYDQRREVYHTISDDQGNRATGDPVRVYTVAIDLGDGTLDDGDVVFTDTTELLDDNGQPFAPGGLDPEGLTMAGPGRFHVSSEGNTLADPIIDPFIRRYNLNGRVTAELPVPDYYRPNGTDRGFRFNLGFESLNLTPDGKHLVTAGEAALAQDGPAATFNNGSLARILVYDLAQREPVAEFVYEVDPWAEPSAIFGVNGIVEVLPVDNAGTMLVMERSFSVGGSLGGGTGNVVIINEISTAGATDTLGTEALYQGGAAIDVTPVSQRLVFAFDDLGLPIDNIEGMTWGPSLPDGRRSLVIVSDNNFGAAQFTQFVVLAVDLQPAG